MRILFMGTPDFAAVSLERLIADGHTICGVFTQPDKPRNRNKVTFSPVKECAITHKLPVYQPLKMRDGEALRIVQELAPELIVVVAYGKILPEEILNAPRYGAINVHASILPKYRGAAPINWAILNGEAETGVSIMYMAKELDAGDVIQVETLSIGPDETAPELWQRLAKLGADTLSAVIPKLENGTAARTPQDHSRFTYAPMLSRELSPIDWNRSSRQIHDQVRGLLPWPCAATELNGKKFKIFETRIGEKTDASAGTLLSAGKQGIQVACGDGTSLTITELQADGGKRMSAAAYLLGHPMKIADRG